MKQTSNMKKRQNRELAQIGAGGDRQRFWLYCLRAALGAQARAAAKGVACSIDAHLIDSLLVDQKWRCAVSGIDLVAPVSGRREHRQHPFGPSLDRIVPASGYVPGNVRVVCNIVNSAMNEWGQTALDHLVWSMSKLKRP